MLKQFAGTLVVPRTKEERMAMVDLIMHDWDAEAEFWKCPSCGAIGGGRWEIADGLVRICSCGRTLAECVNGRWVRR